MDTPANSTSTNQAGAQAGGNTPTPAPLSPDELNTLHALAQAVAALSKYGPQTKTNGSPVSDVIGGTPSDGQGATSPAPTTADYASAAAQLAIYQVASPSTTAAWLAFVPPAVAAADAAINPKRRPQAVRGLAVSGAIGLVAFLLPRLIR